MKICCVTDIHGHLPQIPECDLLLIGGDIVPMALHEPPLSAVWLESAFKPWVAEIAKRARVIGISGNHEIGRAHV